jgi:hypothetical protein
MNDQPNREDPANQSSQRETPSDSLQPPLFQPPLPNRLVNATRAGSSGRGVNQRNTTPPPPPPPKPIPYSYVPDQEQENFSHPNQPRYDRYEHTTKVNNPGLDVQNNPADQRERIANYAQGSRPNYASNLNNSVSAKRPPPMWVWVASIVAALIAGGSLAFILLPRTIVPVVGIVGAAPTSASIIVSISPTPVPMLTTLPIEESTSVPPTEIPTSPPSPPTPTCCEVDVQATDVAIAEATDTAVAKKTQTAEAKETKAAKTETAIAAETEVAIVIETETAIAAKTQTAEAKETKAAKTAVAGQNSEAVGRALYASAIWIFGPTSVELKHDPSDNQVKVERAGVSLRDFVVQAAFLNPYSTTRGMWDYGFKFRGTGNASFRLIVTSKERWYLLYPGEVNASQASQSGTLSNLDTSVGAGNNLVFIAIGVRGYFFVNGLFVDTLDLSAKTDAGDVSVGTGFYSGSEIEGESTYVGFSVGQFP